MTTYRATRNIPDTPNDPSVDQPPMKINNNSFIDLIDVDHIGYNQPNGGYHDIIHQGPQGSDPAALVNIGQTYTKTVDNNVELFYRAGNATATGAVQQITNGCNILCRAAVNFSVGASPGYAITINSSFNVSSVVRNALGLYTVTFTNALSSAFYYPSVNGVANSGYTVSMVTLPTVNNCVLAFGQGSSTGIDPNSSSPVSLIIFQ